MKNENNIEKNIFYRIFYRIFSFIRFRGLLYFFFPLSEISRWQELRAGAQEEISKFDKELKKIEIMQETIEIMQDDILKAENTLYKVIPANKKILPPLGSSVQIGTNITGCSTGSNKKNRSC